MTIVFDFSRFTFKLIKDKKEKIIPRSFNEFLLGILPFVTFHVPAAVEVFYQFSISAGCDQRTEFLHIESSDKFLVTAVLGYHPKDDDDAQQEHRGSISVNDFRLCLFIQGKIDD